MIFTARLRNKQTGEIYPAMYCTPSFKSAEQDAIKAFPMHEVITVYPQLMEERIRWMMRESDEPEQVTECANKDCRWPIHKGDSVWRTGGRLYCGLVCAITSAKPVKGVIKLEDYS